MRRSDGHGDEETADQVHLGDGHDIRITVRATCGWVIDEDAFQVYVALVRQGVDTGQILMVVRVHVRPEKIGDVQYGHFLFFHNRFTATRACRIPNTRRQPGSRQPQNGSPTQVFHFGFLSVRIQQKGAHTT